MPALRRLWHVSLSAEAIGQLVQLCADSPGVQVLQADYLSFIGDAAACRRALADLVKRTNGLRVLSLRGNALDDEAGDLLWAGAVDP